MTAQMTGTAARRPRVAWLSAETPDRNGSGGQRRQFHQIRALLAVGIDVDVATLAGPQDDASVRELAPVRRFGRLRARGFRTDPELDRFLADGRFTAAIVAHIESVAHVRRALSHRGVPWLLDLHNVNSRWHRARRERVSATVWAMRERMALSSAEMATVCSLEERNAVLRLASGARVEVAGHGIDPAEWPDAALARERTPALAFFAAWDHGPNREGAHWLAERVWPALLRSVPEARLLLAGPGDPPPSILDQPAVEHSGRVEDLARFLGGVRVVAVPIVNGIGARMKFGEALASGAAVVSTSTGAEGFQADGAFVCADEAEDFVQRCAELLRDDRRAAALGRTGRAFALERLGWEATTGPIVAFVRRTAG